MRVFVTTTTFALFASAAAAVTIDEYDSVSREQQDAWLIAQTRLMEQWYKDNGREDLAACIENLRARSVAATNGDHSQGRGLFELIDDRFATARHVISTQGVDPNSLPLEGLIAGAIEDECTD